MDNYGPGYQQPTPNWTGGQGSYLANSMNQFNQQRTPQRLTPDMRSQPTNQPSMIPGRMVNSINDIVPVEVPMDGNTTYFPTSDGEVIHACYWTREGKIETVNYIREKPNRPPALTMVPNEEGLNMIMARLDEMQKEIKRLAKPRHRNSYDKTNRNGQEKEVNRNV